MNSQALNKRDRRWQQIQAITGLIFALFVFTYLANTILAPAGASSYDSFQEVARQIYQHLVVEILLLAVILPGHILAGVMRARIRRGRVDVRVGPIARAQRWAGWYLVIVIYLHAVAVRLPALLYDVWPRFEGVAIAISLLAFGGVWFEVGDPMRSAMANCI